MADTFLIAPQGADLNEALNRLPAKAVLLLRDDDGYATWARAAIAIAQAHGAAVLIEGEPADVKALGADGLHVTGGPAALTAAIKALKPQFIVGGAGLRTRDEAMTAGEAGVDYVFFGPTSGSIDERTREMARWWAETMEVPSVLSDPEATGPSAESEGCEFIGLGDKAWR